MCACSLLQEGIFYNSYNFQICEKKKKELIVIAIWHIQDRVSNMQKRSGQLQRAVCKAQIWWVLNVCTVACTAFPLVWKKQECHRHSPPTPAPPLCGHNPATGDPFKALGGKIHGHGSLQTAHFSPGRNNAALPRDLAGLGQIRLPHTGSADTILQRPHLYLQGSFLELG